MFGINDRDLGGGGGTGYDLDTAPPHESPRPADPTRSLKGEGRTEGTGPLATSPTARGIAAVAAILHGINELEGLVPGALTPQFILEASQLQMTIPELLMSMSQTGSSSNLLAAAIPGMGGSDAAMGGMPMSGVPPQPSLAQSAGFGSAGRRGGMPV